MTPTKRESHSAAGPAASVHQQQANKHVQQQHLSSLSDAALVCSQPARCPLPPHGARQGHVQFGDGVQVLLDALLQELNGRQQLPHPGTETP